jgi:alkylresorcinol/alkylpyrone synthase
LLQARPDGVAVILSVELCSLTLLIQEPTKVNLVGAALFGDGAGAAVVLGPERAASGAAILATETALFPDSSHLMGWRFSESGFSLLLSPDVPAFIAREFPSHAGRFLRKHGLDLDRIRHFALHPGGRQVLEAYRRGLGVSAEQLAPTREALRRFGNLSSASVLFSLDQVARDASPAPGDLGFLAAMGPGFATEMLILRWA